MILTAILPFYLGARTEVINNYGVSRLYLAICQVQFIKTPISIKMAYHWYFSRKKTFLENNNFEAISAICQKQFTSLHCYANK